MTASTTIYRDAGKPNRAVPVTTECALPGAFTPGEVTASPTPNLTPTAAVFPSAEMIHGEAWVARHNAEIWGAWRNDATGYSFED
jgi:hypothetical protein